MPYPNIYCPSLILLPSFSSSIPAFTTHEPNTAQPLFTNIHFVTHPHNSKFQTPPIETQDTNEKGCRPPRQKRKETTKLKLHNDSVSSCILCLTPPPPSLHVPHYPSNVTNPIGGATFTPTQETNSHHAPNAKKRPIWV